jgi:diguanylate cyclase (GGDEF)-like protein
LKRILIVDDSPIDAELEVRALREASLDFTHLVATNEASFRAAIRDFEPDLILCDFSFPGFDGLSALRITREIDTGVPFIFVSGTIGEERAVAAIRQGAVDYVLKSNLVRLPSAVQRALDDVVEKNRRFEAERRVAHLSRIRDVLSIFNSTVLRLRAHADIFKEACSIATGVGRFDFAAVVLYDDVAGTTDLVSAQGLRGGQAAKEIEKLTERVAKNVDDDPGVLAVSLRTAHPKVVNDLELADPLPLYSHLLSNGINSVGSFPIVVNGKCVGAMLFGAHEASFFDDDEIQLLANLSGNLSFALDLVEKQQRVDYLSYYDPLTELPNRTLYLDRLRQELAASRRAGEMLAVIVLDVERFATASLALHEHLADEVLREIAVRLRATVGEQQVARISGGQFAITVPGLRDARGVLEILGENGIRCFQAPIVVQGRALRAAVHAGCAIAPNDGHDAEDLLRNAVAALQSAKSRGAPYEFYSAEIGTRLAERVELELKMRAAIAASQFVLHYQPKVNLATRELVGLEALIRWSDPDRSDGLIQPNEFVPILEQTGMITEAGRWALHEAARQHAEWRDRGLRAPRIAVNLSTVQLRQDELVDDVRTILGSFGGECGIDLEITESVLMENFDVAGEKLRRLRDFGMEIAIDDFGSGYSSLAYLHRLPISTLKIDRSLVSGMTEDSDKTTIVGTIISLAQALKLKVVAEGVETDAQAHLLKLLRCDQVQGFLVGRPGSAHDIEGLIGAGTAH